MKGCMTSAAVSGVGPMRVGLFNMGLFEMEGLRGVVVLHLQ